MRFLVCIPFSPFSVPHCYFYVNFDGGAGPDASSSVGRSRDIHASSLVLVNDFIRDHGGYFDS